VKKLAILISLALVFCFSHALDHVPGPGGEVITASEREYDFAYHSGTDDYHFYGSDVWAVRFDFSEVYPSFDTSEFEVNKALLYLPQTGDSVRVELFTDVLGTPGNSLTWAKVAVTQNHMEIPFPQTVQNDSLWLVVTYATDFYNRFVSASVGEGTHSYYWNTNAQNPYFQSMANAGYNAELLFGLAGDFVLTSPDLQLIDFDLAGTIEPGEIVGPKFKLYNHSDQTINDAVLEMNVYSPDPGFGFFDTINLTESIPPRSYHEFDEQSAGYTDHTFELPHTPLQLKLRAEISSDTLDADPASNNVKLIHRFSFDESYPIFLAENFLRCDNSSQITLVQDQYDFPQIGILNYFPILSDSLGNVAAQIRFNWYDFNSLPRTAINGDMRINGFSTSYGTQYSQLCAEAPGNKTFISDSECRFNYNAQNDLLTTTITLFNDATLLYSSATEYNVIARSRLSVGIFRKIMLDGAERYVISHWVTHSEPLDGTLGVGENYASDYNIVLNNLSLDELNQNYRLYYWLQLSDTKKILYSNYSDFTNVVSTSDELAAIPRLVISSNPLRKGKSMLISLSGGRSLEGLSIYNIRGQKVLEFENPGKNILLRTEMFPASGVYLVRAEGETPDGQVVTGKINIIK